MKRRALIHAGLLSGALWYTTVALATTGHTRILWGLDHVVGHAQHVAEHGYRAIQRLEGDRGLPPLDP